MLFWSGTLQPLVVVLTAAGIVCALDSYKPRFNNAQSVNLWKLLHHRVAGTGTLVATDASKEPRWYMDLAGAHDQAQAGVRAPPVSVRPTYSTRDQAEFSEETFMQPLDHFSNSTDKTFPQRFWVNKRHYRPRPGAPVIVIDGGETSGEGRLPYLDTGIANILARATGGIGVVLEHRYYGKSVGVQNFSTDALRWLNNEQALEDSANFMRNVKFQGIDEDLTAPNTPWIYYGGSYAGARAAHMRVLYPDLVFGAIGSSAVTHAALTIWEYTDVIRLAADAKCSANLVKSISTIDGMLKISYLRGPLKKLFGLDGLKSDQDFVSVLTNPLGSWQDRNWDPAVGSTTFVDFCATLNGDTPSLQDTERTVLLPGGPKVNVALLSYAKWIRENVVNLCPQDKGMTVEDCFGTNDDSKYQAADLGQEWRPWTFQVCTQWGYLMTAPPNCTPTIISRLLDIDYQHKICTQAFPPGKYYQVPPLPNVTAVNALGDYNIAADRLALIDGEFDPWRPYTPHSTYGGAVERNDTLLRPFKLIPGGVHHWDENGLMDGAREPKDIRQIHDETIEFVKAWLKDWERPVAK